jgi:hypothetical protein
MTRVAVFLSEKERKMGKQKNEMVGSWKQRGGGRDKNDRQRRVEQPYQTNEEQRTQLARSTT